jgi:hypothetical protein
MMMVISRVVGVHKLLLLNFYPLLQVGALWWMLVGTMILQTSNISHCMPLPFCNSSMAKLLEEKAVLGKHDACAVTRGWYQSHLCRVAGTQATE